MPRLRTTAVPALTLLLGLLATVGCSDSEAAPNRAHAASVARDDRVAIEAFLARAERASPRPPGYWFETILRGPLPRVAVDIVPYPDHGAFFVLGRDGQLFHYPQGFEDVSCLANLRADGYGYRAPGRVEFSFGDVYGKGDLGSLGLALDPDFLDNHFLYVWYTDGDDEHLALDRFTWSDDLAAVTASRTNVIRFSRCDPAGPYHMGGILKFLPDGTLLIATGDAEHPELSQDPKNLNGKLLRIIPRKGSEGGYDIPADNPFVGDESHAPEVVAVGLRAPFRATLVHGRHLVFGDVGAVHEEINVWSGGAADFAWGSRPHADGPQGRPDQVDPVIWWTRQDDFSKDDPAYNGESRLSAGVGIVYEDPPVDRYGGRLTGKLIFFDIMRGWVRSAELDDDLSVVAHEHLGHLQFISDTIVGKDGYIYFLRWGEISTLVRLRWQP